jgi:hypothetical protein
MIQMALFLEWLACGLCTLSLCAHWFRRRHPVVAALLGAGVVALVAVVTVMIANDGDVDSFHGIPYYGAMFCGLVITSSLQLAGWRYRTGRSVAQAVLWFAGGVLVGIPLALLCQLLATATHATSSPFQEVWALLVDVGVLGFLTLCLRYSVLVLALSLLFALHAALAKRYRARWADTLRVGAHTNDHV